MNVRLGACEISVFIEQIVGRCVWCRCIPCTRIFRLAIVKMQGTYLTRIIMEMREFDGEANKMLGIIWLAVCGTPFLTTIEVVLSFGHVIVLHARIEETNIMPKLLIMLNRV